MKPPVEIYEPLSDRELKLAMDAYERRRLMRKKATDKIESFKVDPMPSMPGGFRRVIETYRLYPVRLRWEVTT